MKTDANETTGRILPQASALSIMVSQEDIQRKIYTIRGVQTEKF